MPKTDIPFNGGSTRVFRTTGQSSWYPYGKFQLVGVKRYTPEGQQIGEVRKLKPDATEDELQLAEDRALTTVNLWERLMPTWA